MAITKAPNATMKSSLKEVSSLLSESKTSNDSVDFVQCLNTTLCFLCWINADVSVVEDFLKNYPEALLLEGTSQDSAYRIVEERMKACRCNDSSCNDNRSELLSILEHGFGHYQEMHMHAIFGGARTSEIPGLQSLFLFPQLMSVGSHLRGLQVEESAVRSQVLEIDVDKVALSRELETLSSSLKKSPRSMVRSLFSCNSKESGAVHNRIALLESQVKNAEMKLQSAQQEHKLLVGAINTAHIKQFELLRDAFSGCYRHRCKAESGSETGNGV